MNGYAYPHFVCRVCGSPLYCTDHGNHELTYHCSSPEARFWVYERGTAQQVEALTHWEQSKIEFYPEKGEIDAGDS